ncbi:hypothetical protein [Sphingomonas qomolangmaensis]|uniref:Uncharacterized protein n=1 Tax=Sphingomonas qomolangmaensis TaxID=2918765 RepID=A0ABY5L796_9SPHN|nr:hypothetical protein [Sphingomonas qomolangmaensis]UUL82835.1 hypothetical protein NMP03_00910 [Sphingomonas qomolangmaensis]
MHRPRSRSTGAIFAVPLLLAVASMIGLVAALLGDGAADIVSWVALALPVAAVIWAMRFRRG